MEKTPTRATARKGQYASRCCRACTSCSTQHGEVIYVGKAKALKNRVTSYFRGEHLPKVAAMVAHVERISTSSSRESEFEALVLENSLIKLHKPKYNILLKDDKGYPFVRLDRDASRTRRFSLVNRTEKDGAKYFGPYGGRSMTAEHHRHRVQDAAPADVHAACSRATSAAPARA